MDVEEALVFLDTVLQHKFLNNLQELVFRQAWAGQTYPEMAESSGYDPRYVKDVGYKLWRLLAEVFKEEVTKSNFRSVIRRQHVASRPAWHLGNVFLGEAFPARGESPQSKDSVCITAGVSASVAPAEVLDVLPQAPVL